mmetsp:Transcript_4309/g.12573  ORF Transcript_4309/g.12573 Transcript_4309/m.12573 type:complete len:248 (-) Transcript_4309:478-1221(-)
MARAAGSVSGAHGGVKPGPHHQHGDLCGKTVSALPVDDRRRCRRAFQQHPGSPPQHKQQQQQQQQQRRGQLRRQQCDDGRPQPRKPAKLSHAGCRRQPLTGRRRQRVDKPHNPAGRESAPEPRRTGPLAGPRPAACLLGRLERPRFPRPDGQQPRRARRQACPAPRRWRRRRGGRRQDIAADSQRKCPAADRRRWQFRSAAVAWGGAIGGSGPCLRRGVCWAVVAPKPRKQAREHGAGHHGGRCRSG